MKILLTGGCGNLGAILSHHLLLDNNNQVIRFDINKPTDSAGGKFQQGSILDRRQLAQAMLGVDMIVHIAAWHGFDEFTGEKNAYDFWDLNVTGTFNVLQAAVDHNIKNFVFLSSESIKDQYGIYGSSKVMAESLIATFVNRHHINAISLRAGAFIPHRNRRVYPHQPFIEWAKWFVKGAVHIDDMAIAVIQSIGALQAGRCVNTHWQLEIDGAYDYTAVDLAHWDEKGVGTTFQNYYADYHALLKSLNVDLTIKPHVRDITQTTAHIGYIPHYSLKNLLQELQQFGADGPPVDYVN